MHDKHSGQRADTYDKICRRKRRFAGCTPKVRALVDSGPLSELKADRLRRLSASDQDEAADKILPPVSERQAARIVREEFTRDLQGVKWGWDDASLVPVKRDDSGARVFGGPCAGRARCPFRRGMTCFRVECFTAKESAYRERQAASQQAQKADIFTRLAKERFRFASDFSSLKIEPDVCSWRRHARDLIKHYHPTDEFLRKFGLPVHLGDACNSISKLSRRELFVFIFEMTASIGGREYGFDSGTGLLSDHRAPPEVQRAMNQITINPADAANFLNVLQQHRRARRIKISRPRPRWTI